MSELVLLGDTYRDELTGYEGVATARTEFLYGCVHITLEGKLKSDASLSDPQIFDEQRLVRVRDDKKPKATARAGGPRARAPRSAPRR